jgi:hypothetical protein
MYISQIILFIILIFVLYIVFIFPILRRTRERLNPQFTSPRAKYSESFYGRPGIPSVPLDIPIPELPIKDLGTFVNYSGTDFHQICPSKPGTRCNNVMDCGPAELCVNQAGWIADDQNNSQPSSSVCVCSMQNACISGENIC